MFILALNLVNEFRMAVWPGRGAFPILRGMTEGEKTVDHGRQMPSIRRVIFRGVALILGLGIALILAEGISKVADVVTASKRLRVTRHISRTSAIPGVRYELIPNIESITPGERAIIRVNNLGFRGPDVPLENMVAVYEEAVAYGTYGA